MSDLGEFKARLLEGDTPFFSVRGATSMAQVTEDVPAGTLPMAFVLVVEEQAGENQRATGSVLQRLERDVAIVIVAQHLGDADGADVADPLEALKTFVRQRLLGWQTSQMADVITYVRGEMVEATEGIAWFNAVYSAPQYIEEQA